MALARQFGPTPEPLRIKKRNSSDKSVRIKSRSIHGHGNPFSPVPQSAMVKELSEDQLIDRLSGKIAISVDMRANFEAAIRDVIDDFRSRQAHEALPAIPAREYRPRENIIDYLRSPEGFGPWIDAGALTRPLLRDKSPKAYMALANWLRNNELPSDLSIPTKSETVSAALGRSGNDVQAAARLGHAAASRLRRAP